MTLDMLLPGQSADILDIDETGDETLHRLDELGFVPGQCLTMLQEAPLGDPLAVRILNYELCIRKKEASLIRVRLREGDC